MLNFGGLNTYGSVGGGNATFSGNVTALRFLSTAFQDPSSTWEIGAGNGILLVSGHIYFQYLGNQMARLEAGTYTLELNAVNGANAIEFQNTGSRLKLSAGGTLDYLYSDGATVLKAAGSLVVGDIGGNNQLVATVGTGTAQSVVGGRLTTDTTAVGNVGAGTDTLMTYSLPASALINTGSGIRITAWGTTANTAAAKTVTLDWGSQTIMTQALTANIAGTWRISAYAIRTGASTQDCFAELLQLATIIHKHTLTAGTQAETGAVVIKCTGTATSNNDIVQEGLIVEYIA
jgi:hypothetical protein